MQRECSIVKRKLSFHIWNKIKSSTWLLSQMGVDHETKTFRFQNGASTLMPSPKSSCSLIVV
ncbi:hypothetical protein VFA_000917 [Vibrio furnissii CIP 102972]|nr:hypothetical protein VFA_000917 [Vibrio furnissii CIP 102972]